MSDAPRPTPPPEAHGTTLADAERRRADASGASATGPRHAALLRLLSIGLVVAALYLLRSVLAPLAIAILLSVALAPVVTRLQRLGLPNVLAVGLVTTLVCGSIGGLAFVISRQFVELTASLPRYRQNIEERVRSLRIDGRGPIGEAARMVEDIQRQIETTEEEEGGAPAASGAQPSATGQRQEQEPRPVPVRVTPPKTSPLDLIGGVLGPLLGPLAGLGIVVVFVVFFLLYRRDLGDRLLYLAGRSHPDVTTGAVAEAERRISRYLLAHIALNGMYGLATGVGLWLIGLPAPALWGMLAGALRFLPYVGPWTGALLPLALSLAVFDGWNGPLSVAGLFLALELVSNNALEPWLYGASTGLSTVAVLVAALFWGWLWGPIGIVLSVPMTVVLVVLGRYLPPLAIFTVLFGDEGTLAPAVRFYHRVLAGAELDQLRPRRALEPAALVELLDEVVLPAISMEKSQRARGALGAEQSARFHGVVEDALGELEGDDAPLDERALPCVPASEESDELAARLAAVALAGSGRSARCVPREELAVARSTPPAAVLVCSCAPHAWRDVRQACREARLRFPGARLLVGLWGRPLRERASPPLGRLGVAGVSSSLAGALEQLEPAPRVAPPVPHRAPEPDFAR